MEPLELNLDIPESGAVFAFGKKVPGRFHIKNDSIISAACGEEHALVVTSSGRLFAFGKNDSGQLGLGHREPSVAKPTCVKRLRQLGEKAVRVACGPTHSLVTTESGKVYGFGINTDGQLTGQATDYVEPVEIQHLAGKEVKDLAAGRSFSLVLTKTGEIFAWGSNEEGCLGCGDSVTEVRDSLIQVQLPDRATSLSAGTYHCACVLSNGQIYTWGETEGGKLGRPDSESQPTQYLPQLAPLPPAQTDEDAAGSTEPTSPQPPKARAVACGLKHTLALSESGRVFACGSGDSGQLGLGVGCCYSPIFAPVPALESLPMACISAGECHSACVSSEAGYLYTFGDALHGKLGPSSRLGGHCNQHRPFRVGPLKPVRARRAVCGNVLTLVLAAQRAPGDPAVTAAAAGAPDNDETDDPLDSMSARSSRPLRQTELAALEATTGAPSSSSSSAAATAGDAGGGLLRRRSSRSRQRYREQQQAARSSGAIASSLINGDALELTRPTATEVSTASTTEEASTSKQPSLAAPQSNTTNEEAISKFDQLLVPLVEDGVEDGAVEKEEAAEAACEPEVKPRMERRPSEAVAFKMPEPGEEPPPSQQPEDDGEEDEQRAQPADQQPAGAPVLIETSSEQRPGEAVQEEPVAKPADLTQPGAEEAAPTEIGATGQAAGTSGAVKGVGCCVSRRQKPGEAATGAPTPEGRPADQGGAVEEAVVAADSRTAESAPPSAADAEAPQVETGASSAGTSGAVKGVGCCGSRRQKPEEASTGTPPSSEDQPADQGGDAVEQPVVASDSTTAESAPPPSADVDASPNEKSAAAPDAGTSGAVKGVGCCGSRRQKPAAGSPPAEAPNPADQSDAVEEAVVAADSKTVESAPPAPDRQDGPSAQEESATDGAGTSRPVRGVGCCGSSRRQRESPPTESPAPKEPAADRDNGNEDDNERRAAADEAPKDDTGSSGAVKNVGCGRSRRRRQTKPEVQQQQQPQEPGEQQGQGAEAPAGEASEAASDAKSSKSCSLL